MIHRENQGKAVTRAAVQSAVQTGQLDKPRTIRRQRDPMARRGRPAHPWPPVADRAPAGHERPRGRGALSCEPVACVRVGEWRLTPITTCGPRAATQLRTLGELLDRSHAPAFALSNLTKSQAVACAVEMLPVFEAEAKARQAHGSTAPGKGRTLVDPGPQAKDSQNRAREHAANVFGVSGRHVQRAKKLKQTAPQLVHAVDQAELERLNV
jgi:hypothetical protein